VALSQSKFKNQNSKIMGDRSRTAINHRTFLQKITPLVWDVTWFVTPYIVKGMNAHRPALPTIPFQIKIQKSSRLLLKLQGLWTYIL